VLSQLVRLACAWREVLILRQQMYTIRDPPFRRWETAILSEHLSLGDLRGAIL
jgi:hypothetical protein